MLVIHTANNDVLLLPHFGLSSLFFQLAAIKLNSNIETICAATPLPPPFLPSVPLLTMQRLEWGVTVYQFEFSPAQPVE